MDKDLQTIETQTETEVRLGDRNQRLWRCGSRGRKSTGKKRGNNGKGNTEEEAVERRKSRMCEWMMEICQKREEEEHEAGKQKEGAIRLSEK